MADGQYQWSGALCGPGLQPHQCCGHHQLLQVKPLQSHKSFLSHAPTETKSCVVNVLKGGGDLENDPPSLCMFVSRLKASFVVSGSQDCTVKVWDLPADLSTSKADVHQLTPRATEKAHDKVQAHFRKEGKKTCNYL